MLELIKLPFLLLVVNNLKKLYFQYILSVSMDFIMTMASNYCFLPEGIENPASYALQDVVMSNNLCCCVSVDTFHLYFSLYSWCLTSIPMLKYGISVTT